MFPICTLTNKKIAPDGSDAFVTTQVQFILKAHIDLKQEDWTRNKQGGNDAHLNGKIHQLLLC